MKKTKKENSLKIGEYIITILDDEYEKEGGTLWIENKEGEGGNFKKEDIEKIIETFFDKNF